MMVGFDIAYSEQNSSLSIVAHVYIRSCRASGSVAVW